MDASLSLILTLAVSAASPSWRFFPEPADAVEAQLVAAVASAAADALPAVSRQNPGTAVSGLARLAAGWSRLDSRRYAEAIAELTHPDVQRTSLRDHAWLATGRAQEALGQSALAARSYLNAAAEPASAVACTALPAAAGLLMDARRNEDAIAALEQVVATCPHELRDALLALGEAHLARGDAKAAAAAFDRLDREYPASTQAGTARAKLKALPNQLPARSAEERARLLFQRGDALLSTGRGREALDALRAVRLEALPAAEADLARVRLARALFTRGRARDARLALQKVAATSPHAAQAAFLLAREDARRSRTPAAFESVANRFPGTPWGEEALLSVANHYQKDALDGAALPWWRRLLAEYPNGRYVERAAWRAAWADFLAGRYEAAAVTFESTARLRPPSSYTSGLLYWAGRARVALHQGDEGRRLLEEAVRRYKHAYHGLRAREALSRLPGTAVPRPALIADGPPEESPLPEPRATRLRQLLMIDRLDEAAQELRLLPESSRGTATLAWIDWRRGRLRSALVLMKRAYPEWVSEAGDRLPPEVWHVLYPLRYGDELRAAAEQELLDPALVAALVLQESSFDPDARSGAGARGLMQVMPPTGRRLARAKGQRFRRAALHDPETSLDFGTHYLRLMSDSFDGSVEKVLAAYNAGPHRVAEWMAERGRTNAEEFIESIPFSETRNYVMVVLANREHYRRIYGLGRKSAEPPAGGARP